MTSSMPRYNLQKFQTILLTLIACLCITTSCVQKDPLFGNNMVPPGQQMKTEIDSNLKIKTYNVAIDSIVSGNISTIMLIGSGISPISGVTEASILTNYMPEGFPNDKYFGTNARIDSMKVLFNVKYEKGDTAVHSKLEIYEFKGVVFKDYKKYFSNFPVESYLDPQPLLSIDIPGHGGALTGFLPLEYAKKYLYNEPSEKNPYNSDTLFHEVFNGIYLKIVPGNEKNRAFYSLSLASEQSRMFLYYRSDEFRDSAQVQRMFFTSPDINFTSRNTSLAIYKHDYTKADINKGGIDPRTINDTINPQPKGYVSGPVGLATYIELDTESIDQLKQRAKEKGYNTIALHKAELHWTIVDQTWQNYDISFQAIGMYYNFEGPLFMPDYNYLEQQQNSALPTTLGGNLNRSIGIYSQDITRYLQSYISGRNTKTKLQVAPVVPDRFIYASTVVWGSNAPNEKHRPKLILTYTLLK